MNALLKFHVEKKRKKNFMCNNFSSILKLQVLKYHHSTTFQLFPLLREELRSFTREQRKTIGNCKSLKPRIFLVLICIVWNLNPEAGLVVLHLVTNQSLLQLFSLFVPRSIKMHFAKI